MTEDHESRLRRLGDRLEEAVAAAITHGDRGFDESRNNNRGIRHKPAVQSTATTTHPSTEVTDMISKRSSRRLVIASIIGAAAIAGVGTVAAIAITVSDDEVEQGMPAGAALFEGTDPTCTTLLDDVFWCELATPLPEVMVPLVTAPAGFEVPRGGTLDPADSLPANTTTSTTGPAQVADHPTATGPGASDVPEIIAETEFPANYRGTMYQFLDSESRVAGGCVAIDSVGQIWLCVAGQESVDIGLIPAAMLGQEQSGPAVG